MDVIDCTIHQDRSNHACLLSVVHVCPVSVKGGGRRKIRGEGWEGWDRRERRERRKRTERRERRGRKERRERRERRKRKERREKIGRAHV